MKLKKTLAVACAMALGLGAVAVSAENLDLDEMGAALALPLITGEFQGNPLKLTGDEDIFEGSDLTATLITVTNGRNAPVRLRVDVISGDTVDLGDGTKEPSGENWQSTSFDCDLTARETTTFLFVPPLADRENGDLNEANNVQSSEVYVECSDGEDTAGEPKALLMSAEVGIVFIAAADPETGETISEDVLFGEAVIVDYTDGEALSVGAIAFQAGSGQNDGDKIYRFDGSEYAQFPAVLATNFIAPRRQTTGPGTPNETELILFTLDGSPGNLPVPRVKIGGLAYNDDEVYFDFSYEFDCFDIVQLDDINLNFEFRPETPGLGLGSMSGHLELVVQPIATGFDAHDAQFGDGNNVRRRAVHGWIIGNFEQDGIVVPADQPIPGTPEVKFQDIMDKGAYGRPLQMSTTAIIPFLDDDPATLDADVRN